MKKISTQSISESMGWPLDGSSIEIERLGLCNRVSSYSSVLSYVSSEKYLKYVKKNPAVTALVLPPELYSLAKNELPNIKTFFVQKDSEFQFYMLHEHLVKKTDFYETENFPSRIPESCSIHPSAVIAPGVRLGENSIIGPNSVVLEGTEIGDNVVIGCNSVIGGDGFQVIYNPARCPFLIHHVGKLVIGDRVNIGNCVTISKSLFEGATVIGNDCKIDNHVHVAHNCILGERNVLTAGVLLLGSAEICNQSWIGPNAVLMNRSVVEDNAFVGTCSMVGKKVKAGDRVFGIPAQKIIV